MLNVDLSISEFEVTRVNLGVLKKETKENWLDQSTQNMLVQSQRDGKEKKEVKHIINDLTEYINSFSGFGIWFRGCQTRVFEIIRSDYACCRWMKRLISLKGLSPLLSAQKPG